MKNTITITIEQYKCLRGHLIKANEIFNSLSLAGSITSERSTSKAKPRESKSQKVNKYKDFITKGERVKKPNDLKK